MADFFFRGDIPGSKSVFNRALIVQSFFPAMDLYGFAGCDDVRFMREGLKHISDHSRIDCGEGGTTFRFMALRTSRQPGVHVLMGTPRLMARPQKGLLRLLHQLGVHAQIKENKLHIVGDGWKKPLDPIKVDTSESSQYASALILSSWDLDFDLEFELVGDKVSESYFTLTLEMLRKMGLKVVQHTENGYLISRGQRLINSAFEVEADMSSMFTMAAAGALAGTSLIQNFPPETKQPDKVFLEIFRKMKIETKLEGRLLEVHKNPQMVGVDWNLFQSPDLFPVLAVVCSWARGTSKLHGAPHLISKESNRIEKVADLFKLLGVQFETLPDGMIIHGNPSQTLRQGVVFNPDQDHRMVMAATLMKLKGHEIQIEHPEAINKSFPEFWDMMGLKA